MNKSLNSATVVAAGGIASQETVISSGQVIATGVGVTVVTLIVCVALQVESFASCI